jgi:hypothetical protein
MVPWLNRTKLHAHQASTIGLLPLARCCYGVAVLAASTRGSLTEDPAAVVLLAVATQR